MTLAKNIFISIIFCSLFSGGCSYVSKYFNGILGKTEENASKESRTLSSEPPPVVVDEIIETEPESLTREGSAEEKTFITISKENKYVNIRSNPSPGDNVIGMAKGGDVLQKLGNTEKWTKINFTDADNESKTGWVSNSVIETNKTKNVRKAKLNKSLPKKQKSSSKETLSPM